ncbi:hypothetical protein J7384_08765 [Endozoicomonas sp. G2_1]|uniref:hypothetical protein n=1 Tax=Endozoicomonas sp. G2_1 TaxID=2821091 RepID=UPI001ADC9129|nr:hypothetical protein [Endozoicomonas sp. G2_1]MBO9490452.1 hypothetical protein [Endozoicomonas sp. G2_1]
MNYNKLTNFQIAELVKSELFQQGLSLRQCCEAFNAEYAEEIQAGFPRLDKDFVQRIKKNNFEINSERVSKLCDFLKIDVPKHQIQEESKLKKEFLQIEAAVQSNPLIEKQVRGLLKNIADIANASTLQGS